MPATMRDAAARKRQSDIYERDRLLYVAMTRAEKWLIVAAAGDIGGDPIAWYDQVRSGMIHSGAAKQAFDLGKGLRLQHGTWPSRAGIKETNNKTKRSSFLIG